MITTVHVRFSHCEEFVLFWPQNKTRVWLVLIMFIFFSWRRLPFTTKKTCNHICSSRPSYNFARITHTQDTQRVNPLRVLRNCCVHIVPLYMFWPKCAVLPVLQRSYIPYSKVQSCTTIIREFVHFPYSLSKCGIGVENQNLHANL